MGWFTRGASSEEPADEPEPAPAVSPEDADADAEDMLGEAVDGLVLPGFTTRADVLEQVLEMAEDEQVDREAATRLVDAVWRRRETEQSAWTGDSGYVALGAAFADLESQGVVARMNFSCCTGCGHRDINDEVADRSQWRGYVFFHEQDTARLGAEPAELYLSFGGFGRRSELDPALLAAAERGDPGADDAIGEAVDVPVGELICATLRGHGLQVVWDGTTLRKPIVTDLLWRKPLPVG